MRLGAWTVNSLPNFWQRGQASMGIVATIPRLVTLGNESFQLCVGKILTLYWRTNEAREGRRDN